MRIKSNISETGQLFLKVSSEDTTETTTRISSYLTKKVDKPIVNEIHNLVMEVGNYNGLSTIETVKQFIENSISEKQIRELIKTLEQ